MKAEAASEDDFEMIAQSSFGSGGDSDDEDGTSSNTSNAASSLTENLNPTFTFSFHGDALDTFDTIRNAIGSRVQAAA
ncbi:MAG: hypothetical protein Q9184_008125, partial [Pyrenodesmia sp. 2 TL-2023]